MTRKLDQAIEAVRRLSPEAQDALAGLLLRLAGEQGALVHPGAEPTQESDPSVAESERRESPVVTAIKAYRAKHGL